MVRWSQVSLAAGYLVELRPVISGVPGGDGLPFSMLKVDENMVFGCFWRLFGSFEGHVQAILWCDIAF